MITPNYLLVKQLQCILKVKNRRVQSVFTWQGLDIDKKDVCLKYMVRAGNTYVWTNKTELTWQSIEDILVIMSEPKLVNNRVQFTSHSDSLEKANLKTRSLSAVKNISFK